MTKNLEMKEKMGALRDYIMETIDDRGYPPTIREICEKFDIKSTSSASYYLRKLEDAGELKINRQKSRGIELTGKRLSTKDVRAVPLVGSITAGIPKLAVEDNDERYYIPTGLFPMSGDLFMLTVIGSSMIDVGIRDGDKVIVKKQNTAESGQIIAALVEDDCATVKRFIKDERGIRLHPENQYMQDLYPSELTILGIVVGLIRTDIK